MTRFFPAVLSGVWALAFVLALMPVPAYQMQCFGLAVLLAGMAALSAMVKSVSSGGMSVPKTPLMALGFLFWALALVSVFLSDVQHVSFLYFGAFSLLPLSFLILVLAPEREQVFRRAGYGIAGVVLLFVPVAAYQYWVYGTVTWPLANPNMMAALFSLAFFAAVGVVLMENTRADRSFASIAAALFLLGVVLTRSQASLMALAFTVALLLFLCIDRVKSRRLELGFVFVFTLITVPFLSFVVPDGVATPLETIAGRIGAAEDLSTLTRAEIWGAGWQMFKDHALTGTGIGTFFLYYPEYRGADYYSSGLMAHGDPLQFAIEMGVLAPFLFYAFVILAVVQTVTSVRGLPGGDVRRVLILTPFCALGALVVHAHVSFPFYTPAVAFLTGAFLAFWMVHTVRHSSTITMPKYVPGAVVLAGFAGLLLFGALGMGEIMVKRADRALMRSDTESFTTYVNAADRLAMGRNAKAYVHAADFAIGVIESNRPFLSREEVESLVGQGHDNLDRAARHNPRLPVIPTRRARLAELQGEEADMEKYLQHALTLDPAYLPARLLLIRLYRRQDKDEAVVELFRDGLLPPYRFPEAENFYLDATHVFDEAGKPDLKSKAEKKLKAFRAEHGERSLSTIF